MMEDKARILDALRYLLNLTMFGQDIHFIDYIKEEDGMELAEVTWADGYTQRINISMDSGIAIIRDVLRGLN